MNVKHSWAKKLTANFPHGKPIFSIDGTRTSLKEGVRLVENGLYDCDDILRDWIETHYQEEITVVVSPSDRKVINRLKSIASMIRGLEEEAMYGCDQVSLSATRAEIQVLKADYYDLYLQVTGDIAKKVNTELRIES